MIVDNGKGFNTAEVMKTLSVQNKLGISGMKERLKLVDGVMDIQSMPGKGTSIAVKVPVPGAA